MNTSPLPHRGALLATSIILSPLVLAALLAGCKSRKRTPAPTGDPAQAVTRLFAAINTKDCQALKRAIGGRVATRMKKEGGCKAFLGHHSHDPLELVRVVSVKKDGRDRSRFLITFVMRKGPREKETRAQVKWIQGHYRVVEF